MCGEIEMEKANWMKETLANTKLDMVSLLKLRLFTFEVPNDPELICGRAQMVDQTQNEEDHKFGIGSFIVWIFQICMISSKGDFVDKLRHLEMLAS